MPPATKHATLSNNLECKQDRVHPSVSFRHLEDCCCLLQTTEDCYCEIAERYCTVRGAGGNDVAIESEIGGTDFVGITDLQVGSPVGVDDVAVVGGEDFRVSSWHCCWACPGKPWRRDCT